ncbi:MAG: DUF6935 domain-containing protein [Sodaliphilus sp.]
MNRILCLVLLLALLVGCKPSVGTSSGSGSAKDADSVATPAVSGKFVDSTTYELCGNVYTCEGNFSPQVYNPDATGVVTFTAFPNSYEEFADLYENFLGHSPQGTAALATMAMELYFRDVTVGEKCVDLICSKGCAPQMKRGVLDKVRAWQSHDSYGQRYLPSAVLKGASPENGYQPQKPYTIEMKASVNKHEKIQISGNGVCLFLYVLGEGWDGGKRSVHVFLPEGGDRYQIWSASSLYMQCKNLIHNS